MTTITEWHRNEYTISTDRALLNIGLVHNYLSNSSYWAKGRSRETVQRSMEFTQLRCLQK